MSRGRLRTKQRPHQEISGKGHDMTTPARSKRTPRTARCDCQDPNSDWGGKESKDRLVASGERAMAGYPPKA
jgi:hypothetical protein